MVHASILKFLSMCCYLATTNDERGECSPALFDHTAVGIRCTRFSQNKNVYYDVQTMDNY